ncbi:MAG: sugar phosphate nucleotidyltransferase [Candidatus Eisenbacteria bacterium]|nr:sugar phosphate nucleotidyltransferase [Candidatus Eisenbacteria bacterium]
METKGMPWAIILAGGRGTRLSALTSQGDGGVVPKQFCSLDGGGSMLRVTLARALSITRPERVLIVLLEEHRKYWSREPLSIPPENLIVQERDRGTGTALLCALLRAHERDPKAPVFLLPSDHLVDSERSLRRTIEEALDESARAHGRVVVLASPSSTPDPSFGWLIPGRAASGRARWVAQFFEKPDLTLAAECVRRGGMRHTLMLVGQCRAFLGLYSIAISDLLGLRQAGLKLRRLQPSALLDLYDTIPSVDIGRDVLEHTSSRLLLLPMPECGWTDIGTVERLEDWWMEHPAALAEVRRRGILPPAGERSEKGGARGTSAAANAGEGRNSSIQVP